MHARSTGPVADAAARSASVAVVGTLVDDPRVVPPKGDLLSFRDVIVATVRVERLESAGREFRVRTPVLVIGSDRAWLGLLPSQQVRVEGRARAS